MASNGVALHWFRKGLRLHDNPALLEACSRPSLLPVFCIDPRFADPEVVGPNRYQFLLSSLEDLDRSLRARGSRLVVVRGNPVESLVEFAKSNHVTHVTFEYDVEPYALQRDSQLSERFRAHSITVSSHCTHTLHSPTEYANQCIKQGVPLPTSYGPFCKLFESMGPPRQDVAAPTIVPPLPPSLFLTDSSYDVPTMSEMGYVDLGTLGATKFPGGETEALRRLHEKVSSAERHAWVCRFEKPNTAPNSLEPSTTVLSPYLKFGALSPAKFYHTLDGIVRGKAHTEPPVSLHGQLLWREFFYLCSARTPNFDKMEGNPTCRQIGWGRDRELIDAWKEARTGFPFIDAIMTQLREEGWIHHLARHAVACFLTRGDLYQHWEEGVRVFDQWLLDADWALNNANWQWLSCSRFFHQFFRVYSPVAFGKKTDPNGDYIRRWLPQLARYPAKYIYSPWEAPLSVQQASGCVVGRDYPRPIVDHAAASAQNMDRLKAAFAASRGDTADGPGSSKAGGSSSTTGKRKAGK